MQPLCPPPRIPDAGTSCRTITTGERRATREDAPDRRLVRSRVHWLAGLLLTLLVGTQSALAIPICGDGICQATGIPPETATSCPDDCGSGPPSTACYDTCQNGDCAPPTSSVVDKDYDGVPDRLEYDLAHRFFPDIRLQTLWYDLYESYLYDNQTLPYTVTPLTVPGSACGEPYQCLEIRYGIASYYDWGVDTGLGTLYEHEGDSEFYAALVQRTTAYATAKNSPYAWQMIRDFTAAHQGELLSDSSKVGVYGSEDVYCGWTAWGRYANVPFPGRTEIYAAKRKHGLYHTVAECNDGGLLFDSCNSNAYNMRNYKGAYLLQNIGNYTSHYNFDTTIKRPDACGTYNVWGGQPFGEAGDYLSKFRDALTWCLPSLPPPPPPLPPSPECLRDCDEPEEASE